MLCEIHRRKTVQPQVAINQHHHGVNGPSSFFPNFPSRVSISPSDSDDQLPNNWCDSPPHHLTPPRGGGVAASAATVIGGCGTGYNSSSVTALSEDNERLRRSNNMLMSELAHMKKLYNDIIYFVQNHVKPVAPSNSYSSSLLLCGPSPYNATTNPVITSNGCSLVQKPLNQLLNGYYHHPTTTNTNHKQVPQVHVLNSPAQSSLTILEDPNSNGCKTKLFGVPLQSKKRLHPEIYASSNRGNMEPSKARLVLEKDDLGLNLMPPSRC